VDIAEKEGEGALAATVPEGPFTEAPIESARRGGGSGRRGGVEQPRRVENPIGEASQTRATRAAAIAVVDYVVRWCGGMGYYLACWAS
jgi:hypothetical protein